MDSFPQFNSPRPCTSLSPPHTRYMRHPSHSSRFYHPHNILWAVQNIKFLIMLFSPFPCHLIPLTYQTTKYLFLKVALYVLLPRTLQEIYKRSSFLLKVCTAWRQTDKTRRNIIAALFVATCSIPDQGILDPAPRRQRTYGADSRAVTCCPEDGRLTFGGWVAVVKELKPTAISIH